jgi:hypothetical protein
MPTGIAYRMTHHQSPICHRDLAPRFFPNRVRFEIVLGLSRGGEATKHLVVEAT